LGKLFHRNLRRVVATTRQTTWRASSLLMICNIEGPPWRRPRTLQTLSHCPREIVFGNGGGRRYECTRRNVGEVFRSRYRRRRCFCDRELRARLAVGLRLRCHDPLDGRGSFHYVGSVVTASDSHGPAGRLDRTPARAALTISCPRTRKLPAAKISMCCSGIGGGVGSSALGSAVLQFSWVKHLPPALLIRLQRPLASTRGSGPTCAA
jgi:hypothetical protein